MNQRREFLLFAGAADLFGVTVRVRSRVRFLVLRPQRVQAWREVDELPGRTLMRDGAWIT
jgi:hypothetical protein